VLSGDEHVAEYKPPSNVVPVEPGKKVADMLISGELVAAIGVDVDHPDVRPLIANPLEAGLESLRTRGHYPANHTIVIKDDLLASDPGLAADVFEAFAQSKRQYVERLRAGQIEKPTAVDRLHQRVMEITGKDPLPYGIEPNRQMLGELVSHCLSQGIITRKVDIDEMFAAGSRGLVG
jgi:4,5-dihydroxyphthalate decarboxylase